MIDRATDFLVQRSYRHTNSFNTVSHHATEEDAIKTARREQKQNPRYDYEVFSPDGAVVWSA